MPFQPNLIFGLRKRVAEVNPVHVGMSILRVANRDVPGVAGQVRVLRDQR